MISKSARRHTAIAMTLLIAANLLTWVWAWYSLRDRPALLGTALLAWVFGLRHAVDVDHIAAIDNVVRKLVHNGRRAWDSGFFFALGHSTTVLGLCMAIVAFPFMPELARSRAAAEVSGALFSAVFLLLIGMVNLLTLRRLWFARHGNVFDTSPAGGLMGRILRPVQRLVGRAWHMLPVGFLFGLGFDTASEVALLVLTAQQVAAGLSLSDVVVFPALFTAGMVMIDTLDGAVMTGAYGWALREPRRKLSYNIAVTALSVFVAIGVGGVELLSLLAAHEDAATGQGSVLSRTLDAVSMTGPFAGAVVAAALLLLWGMAALALRLRPRLME